MDFLLLGLVFGILLNLIANVFQFVRIARKRSGKGITLYGYLITIIANTVAACLADSSYIVILTTFSSFMAVIAISIIWYYRESNEPEEKRIFLIGLFFSFVMIMGVTQTIKSYKEAGITDNVCSKSWSVWLMASLNMAYLAESIVVITAYSITTALALFIMYRCHFELPYFIRSYSN